MTKPDRPSIHYTELTDFPEGDALYHELKTYRRELPRLLAEGHEGKFVLIKGETIIGIFDTHDDAMEAGYKKYLREGFMAQQILEWQPLYRIPWCA